MARRRLVTPETKDLSRAGQSRSRRSEKKGWVVESAEGVRFAYTDTPIPRGRQVESEHEKPSKIRKALGFILPRSVQVPHKETDASSVTHQEQQKAVRQLFLARGEFIDENYPKLFGSEEMGDSARTFTPQEITGILSLYELHLAKQGLIEGVHPPSISRENSAEFPKGNRIRRASKVIAEVLHPGKETDDKPPTPGSVVVPIYHGIDNYRGGNPEPINRHTDDPTSFPGDEF